MAEHTPGPWKASKPSKVWQVNVDGDRRLIPIALMVESKPYEKHIAANARLIAAAPDLLEANLTLEAAELQNANCPECEGEGMPELCSACFPLFDAARIKRRLAIAKAVGITEVA